MSSILDPVNSALQGLDKLTQTKLGGTLAQPNFNILGANIPGIPLISFRDYFLATMQSWVSTIPLRTQFIAIIHKFPLGLTTSMLQSLENTDGSKQDFNIDNARKVLTSYPFQGVVGCIFLQGADIPTESLNASSATIENNRGFIQGSILGNRDAFASNNLTLQFRETNTSFNDFVMRPWLLLAAHHGYVARDKTNKAELLKDPKVDITIIQYSRSYQQISMIPRKVWNFYNCVPLNLSTRNLSYDTESMESYDVSFLYSHYGIQNNLYIPLPDIIQTIAKGNLLNALRIRG